MGIYKYYGKIKMATHVWETHNGSVPKGMHIHHINGVKVDDRIENLRLVTPRTHRRIHSRYWHYVDGVWLRECKHCDSLLPESEYYKRTNPKTEGTQHKCKKCSYIIGKRYRDAKTKLNKEIRDSIVCTVCGKRADYVTKKLCRNHYVMMRWRQANDNLPEESCE